MHETTPFTNDAAAEKMIQGVKLMGEKSTRYLGLTIKVIDKTITEEEKQELKTLSEELQQYL